MRRPGRRSRRAATHAALAIVLSGPAPILSAQGGPGAFVSNVAQVRLVAVVPARVTPAASTRAAGVAWSRATGTGVASIGLAANTAYRVVAHRIERPYAEPLSRIWIRTDTGQLRELRRGEPVLVRRGRSGDDTTILVPFRLSPASDSATAGAPLLRFDVLVEPSL
jgi:hypothetical protein